MFNLNTFKENGYIICKSVTPEVLHNLRLTLFDSVFLSFLCSREDIATYIEEFNRQSTTSKIILEGSRATIEFTDDKNEISDK